MGAVYFITNNPRDYFLWAVVHNFVQHIGRSLNVFENKSLTIRKIRYRYIFFLIAYFIIACTLSTLKNLRSDEYIRAEWAKIDGSKIFYMNYFFLKQDIIHHNNNPYVLQRG